MIVFQRPLCFTNVLQFSKIVLLKIILDLHIIKSGFDRPLRCPINYMPNSFSKRKATELFHNKVCVKALQSASIR